MLTSEQKQISNFYRYPNGMLNVGWLAGFIRGVRPGAKMFYVQQTNNSNLMIPVYLKKGQSIPSRFKEMSPVKVICHIEGGMVDAEHLPGKDDGSGVLILPTERIARAVAIGFDAANILDMPPTLAFDKVPPKGAPRDDPKFEFKPFSRDESMADSSNMVRIAGFVQAVSMQPQDKGEASDCCIILIRQTADESECIPVRYYDKRKAQAVCDRIKRGMPIAIDAAIRVRAKPIGQIDEASGIAPVARYPYLHTIQPPIICTQREIIHTPDWAAVMLTEYAAKRDRKPVAAPIVTTEGLD